MACGVCLLVALRAPVRAQEADNAALGREVAELRALVQKLQLRVDELERREAVVPSAAPPAPAARVFAPPRAAPAAPVFAAAPAPPPAQAAVTTPPAAATVSAPAQAPPAAQAAATTAPAATTSPSEPPTGLPFGTTLNFVVDGYYGYNFNAPIGRVNRLRAYDVSSNSFSLNQAAIVLDSPPDPDHGKRFGARIDLQWGQATQTLQGNTANEPRPDIYRNLFQAYGTYVVPLGNGLTVDFGKWASSLGIESNYTQFQMNYSRSYWFNYLPFYHMGVRANYPVNKRLTVHYWVVNGTNQTEAFNGYKDESFGFVFLPHKNLSWTFNYYLGQEHPDVVFFPNGGAPPDLPTQQGVPFQVIPNPPKGRLHIFDSYMTWQATPKLTVAGEADWVIQRLYTFSQPQHTEGGAFYAQYQVLPRLAFAARAEYLSDDGGLFSGTVQALKEVTLTGDYRFGGGFMMFIEGRRDFSNVPYFYTDMLGILSPHQTTATVGLIWWFGKKEGAW